MELKKLDSGYWFARWSPEVWAQWRQGVPLTEQDFFHPAYAASAERIREAEAAVQDWGQKQADE